MNLRNFLVVFSLVAAISVSSRADEGMWLPQQMTQMGAELADLSIRIDPEELANLDGYPLGAIVQTGGCTGSFVSPDGLILTNFHCATGSLQYNSSAGTDLTAKGFLAESRDQELWNGPGSPIYVTTSVEDVTNRMIGGLDAKLANKDFYRAMDRREKAIIADCERGGGVRCRVVSLFEGLRYASIRQMELRDIRLVYAPSASIGTFGGDQDNFMWPRHAGDWAFFRAYVGKNGLAADFRPENVPYRPRQVLRFASGGVKPGDPVVVPGYPAKTLRYRSSDEVRRMAEFHYPLNIRYMRDYIDLLTELGKKDEETRVRITPTILKYENSLKFTEGALAAIYRTGLPARREAEERDLKEFIRSRKELRNLDVMERLVSIRAESYQTDRRDGTLYWVFRVSPLLNQAVQVYRFSLERTKKDSDRQWGYQQRDLPRLQDMIERSQKSIPPEVDRAGLEYILREAVDLPAGNRIEPIDAALAATGVEDSPGAITSLLDLLYGKTRMTELDERKAMLQQSTAALDARKDSFLQLASALLPLMMEKERVEEARYAALTRLRPRYMEAVMASRGGRLYSDANGSLRLSLGRVKGYSPRDGVIYSPQTTLEGLIEKNRKAAPFDVPPALLEAAERAKQSRWADPKLGTIPVNFLTTADLTTGNSGSPTLDADGEIVGILFDGNYEAMASDFSYDPLLTRSIHVDTRYMFWVMEFVDNAHGVLREIGIPEE